MNLSQFRLIFLATSIVWVLAACNGEDGDDGSVSLDIDALCLELDGLVTEESACDDEEETVDPEDGTGGGEGAGDGIEDPDVEIDPELDITTVGQILNPDDCLPAELGAITELKQNLASDVFVFNRPIRGMITIEKPHQNDDGTLDYVATDTFDGQGIGVQAIACDGTVLSGDYSDGTSGLSYNYEVRVPMNIKADIRLITFGGEDGSNLYWDLSVADNTLAEPTYYVYPTIKSVEPSSGVDIVDFHLPVEWDGTSYGNLTSRPFAILDTANRAMLRLFETKRRLPSEEVTVTPLTIYWSDKNEPVQGDVTKGKISASHFSVTESKPTVYLLGKVGVDTDEYDADVIVENVIHYLQSEEMLNGRNDAITTLPAVDAKLDPRDAFSEGFAKAMAVHLNEQSDFFRNSAGLLQADVAASFSANLEDNTSPTEKGYYYQLSVARAVYDFLDGDVTVSWANPYLLDGTDDDGFKLLSYEVFEAYLETASSKTFTTVYSFLSAMQRVRFANTDSVAENDYFIDLTTGGLGLYQAIATSEDIVLPNNLDDFIDDEDDVKFAEDILGFIDVEIGSFFTASSASAPGAYALNETDNGGLADFLPLYKSFGLVGVPFDFISSDTGTAYVVVPEASAVSQKVCSYNDYGVNNTLGNRRFIAFQVFNKDQFDEVSGVPDSQPDIGINIVFDPVNSVVTEASFSAALYHEGEPLNFGDGVVAPIVGTNQGNIIISLTPNAYILELTTIANLGYADNEGEACFDVTIFDSAYEIVN